MAPPTQAEIQAQRVSVELDKQKIELQKEINELNKQKNIAYRDYLEKLKTGSDKEKEAARRNLQNLEDEIDKQQKLNKEIDEQKKRIEASDKAVKDLSDSFSKLFEIAGNQKAPDIKQMFNIQNAIKGVEDLKKKFQAIAGPGGIGVGGALAKMGAAGLQAYAQAAVNLAIDLGTMETEFMKATGASQDFARSITDSYASTREFGATAAETSQAAQALYTTFTDFTMVSDQQRESLIETAAVMDKLGISNQTFAQAVQLSTKALGMSTAQAEQTMLDMEKFAENLGVAPSQMAEDFVGARNALAKLGQDGTQAFKDLAIAAKTTGLSVERILNLTEKFDTFDGAAQQAGKLNAALGGNFVNAMDLMMATNPAERFEMIRDSIMNTGLSFDEMSYYQKNFFKDALGLSDVGELAALMSGEMDLVAGATEESSQSLLEAKRRAQEMASFQERLNILFAQMIPIITPVIDLLSDLTLYLTENAQMVKAITGVLIILASAFATASGFGTAGGIAGLVLGFSMLTDSIETGTDDLTLFGAILGGIWEVLSAVGEVLYDVAVGIGEFFDLIGLNLGEMENLAEIGKYIGYVLGVLLVGALTALAVPLSGVGAIIAGVVAAFSALGAILYKTRFNPESLHKGFGETGDAITKMGEAGKAVVEPFSMVETAVRGIGSAFSAVLTGAAEFVSVLSDPSTAENVERIASAISQTNPVGAAAFTTAMTATAGAGIAGAVNNAVSGLFGSSGGGQSQQITINVMVDREKLATIVKEINGESALRSLASRGI
jgi:hypothetical protein